MKITPQMTDRTVLQELGTRLARVRLARNLTQAALAEQAGVSKRTVERLESGEVATQLSGFLRVCRALGLAERFELLVPEQSVSPMTQLKAQGRMRQRATGRKAKRSGAQKPWTWGEQA
ncbi:MAG: helix-turn-helix domain-containing protein [Planctomycetota bacterium]|nr:helix-turn-helix domain-containing protein [Planctomycetota bacterium]